MTALASPGLAVRRGDRNEVTTVDTDPQHHFPAG